jgi:inositol phosphorylceramide mannosyltransferase catalytic subunit
VLAAAPHHPYWTLLTQSLKPWDYNYIFPYATISYASGQWFETAIWNKYHAMLPPPDKNPQLEHRLYRMMMDDREGSDEWIYFTQERGGSWKNWDNHFFLFIGDHIILFLLTLFGLLGGCGWIILRRYRRRRGYKPLSNGAARRVPLQTLIALFLTTSTNRLQP